MDPYGPIWANAPSGLYWNAGPVYTLMSRLVFTSPLSPFGMVTHYLKQLPSIFSLAPWGWAKHIIVPKRELELELIQTLIMA